MIGIYKIENKVNGKIYIGQSKNVTRRWHEHVKALSKGSHHSHKLQKDYYEFGITSFTFEVVELCSKNDLDLLEEKYITKFNSLYDGYNVKGESGAIDTSGAYDERGMYIIKINDLLADIQDSAMVSRFIATYISCVGDKQKTHKTLETNKISDIFRDFNMERSTIRKTMKFFKDNGLLIKDADEVLGFRFNTKYIRRAYTLLESDSESIVIYKSRFIDMFNSLPPAEHKRIGYLFSSNKAFDNEQGFSNYSDFINEIANNNIYGKTSMNRFFDKILSIDTPQGKLMLVDHNKRVFINPSVFQSCKSIKNRNEIIDMFNGGIL